MEKSSSTMSDSVNIIDSHTGGEPTRLVISGGPSLGTGSMAQRLEYFKKEYDHFRSAVVCEPRGSDVIVGALLCEPENPQHTAGVIFFNNVGFIGMCGHGTIGLIESLFHMGKIQPGSHFIETPVGVVKAILHSSGAISIQNVSCYRFAKNIKMNVPNYGNISGDIAWGGNWFFLVHENNLNPIPLKLTEVESLTHFAAHIRKALKENNITAKDGAEIDHIEIFGPAENPENHSRNFVLCPGNSYDRSPCGTGTSAKLACLFADGKIKENQIWKQESIVGSVFEGSVKIIENNIIPTIQGRAFVTSETKVFLNKQDPFCYGIHT